ncbi:MAG: hypothetical protein J0I54_06060 [Bosea sp.]|uniref:hypothetical protein n=1 Tax=unclassified Bosea (in: a-proteobacteria) TaxID=2653178 RepID=UPI001AC615C1|nr:MULTISPECIES: hypothetical protein [unclassified Bosea (in: a-proteobacteria)]MBN9456175.1 hypothetical protein [Bosea sp. (in: a-proteobacteria)]
MTAILRTPMSILPRAGVSKAQPRFCPLGSALAVLFVSSARASGASSLPRHGRKGGTVITLRSSEIAEYMLTMMASSKVNVSWAAEGSVVN